MTTRTESTVTPDGKTPLLLVYEDGHTPRPVVIVLHGTRRTKEIGASEHDQYLNQGEFVRVYPDAPLHGARLPHGHPLAQDAAWAGYLRGEGDALRDVIIPVVSGMANEVSSIIDYLLTRPDLVVPHFATYGFSVAGLMSFLAANREPRLDAAVMLCTPVRFQFMSLGMAYQWSNDAIEEAAQHDPMAQPAKFLPTALLFIHGSRDDLVPVEAPRDVYGRLKPLYASTPERLRLSEYPHVRHYLDKPAPYSTLPAMEEIVQLREEARLWLARFLNP
jgi:dienelactone hydrolase